MKKLDIVLVKPGSQKQLYGDLSAFGLTAIEPPLWIALWGGYLRKLGYSVVVYDAEAENWSFEETAEKIRDANPLLTAVVVSGTNPSASTMNMAGAGKIVSLVRELDPSIKTLLAGLHPSALPEQTLIKENTSFVCQGEGFYTLPKLLGLLRNNSDNYSIKGLWYKKDGEVIANPRPLLWKNLDELPMPAWDLLPMKKYRAHNWHCFDNIDNREPYGVLFTSLGCPYNCTFCCINAIFGKPGIRHRSPQNVIQEIDFLVSTYGIRNIKIIDELFAFKEDRVIEICDLIIERGYDLNMWAYARVNSVTPAMLGKMKRAGINWVAYGFETGSKRVLQSVNKRYNLDSVKNVVKMTYDAGLYIVANFIFGLPDDDLDSMQDTLTMAIDINAEWANFYSTMAYPGSRLYDEAIKKGWQLPETWQGYSQYSFDGFPLPTKYLTAGEVLSFRDYAFHAYFESPRYLDKINRLFDIETVGHIQKMTSHKLKRKHTQF